MYNSYIHTYIHIYMCVCVYGRKLWGRRMAASAHLVQYFIIFYTHHHCHCPVSLPLRSLYIEICNTQYIHHFCTLNMFNSPYTHYLYIYVSIYTYNHIYIWYVVRACSIAMYHNPLISWNVTIYLNCHCQLFAIKTTLTSYKYITKYKYIKIYKVVCGGWLKCSPSLLPDDHELQSARPPFAQEFMAFNRLN